jgi:hypothetical protein
VRLSIARTRFQIRAFTRLKLSVAVMVVAAVVMMIRRGECRSGKQHHQGEHENLLHKVHPNKIALRKYGCNPGGFCRVTGQKDLSLAAKSIELNYGFPKIHKGANESSPVRPA